MHALFAIGFLFAVISLLMIVILLFMGDEHAYKMFVYNDEAVHIYLRTSHMCVT